MKHRIGLLAVAAVLLVAACGDDDAAETTTTSAATSTTEGAAGSVTISASDFAFSPSSATVAAGGTVTFTVTGGTHTFTSASDAWEPSGAIAEGSSYPVTLDAAGTYDFFCEFHPSMMGTITVTG